LGRAICFERGEFIVFWGSGDLAPIRSLPAQFRQPCEIDRNLSCLVDRQEAGLSWGVRVGPAMEKAELAASGVIDGKSIWEFGDPPRPRKAVGHDNASARWLQHRLETTSLRTSPISAPRPKPRSHTLGVTRNGAFAVAQ